MPGSFVLNVADAPAFEHPVAGVRILFERPDAPFPDTAVNIQVLRPGQPNCKYHSEGVQEDFLVLAGECLAILDGEERPLRAWDFVHCPPGTKHVIVGAGESRCLIVAVGARDKSVGENWGGYTVDETAAKYSASADEATTKPPEAYAKVPRREPSRCGEDWLPR
jgi:uncharacterized cupin superfamily protein